MIGLLLLSLPLIASFCPQFAAPRTRKSLPESLVRLRVTPGNETVTVIAPEEQEQAQDSPPAISSPLLQLPRHPDPAIDAILTKTESILHTLSQETRTATPSSVAAAEAIYANNYVDLGKIDTVGFDYDYTLVTYTDELLQLIYTKSLERLVDKHQYPSTLLHANLTYDPSFSIRGLAVDKETGWIAHLSYTHKVAVAWQGRHKVSTSQLHQEYRTKRALTPTERKQRLKPLNDLFSMAECCLIADVIHYFEQDDIPYSARNVVQDVLKAVTATHVSGDFHRLVAATPERYFESSPHLAQVLSNLKSAGKRLIFVSNSPYWYVDAGMRYLFGASWQDEWDAVITSKYQTS